MLHISITHPIIWWVHCPWRRLKPNIKIFEFFIFFYWFLEPFMLIWGMIWHKIYDDFDIKFLSFLDKFLKMDKDSNLFEKAKFIKRWRFCYFPWSHLCLRKQDRLLCNPIHRSHCLPLEIWKRAISIFLWCLEFSNKTIFQLCLKLKIIHFDLNIISKKESIIYCTPFVLEYEFILTTHRSSLICNNL